MKFTIENLKTKGPLINDHYAKVYEWDYITYSSLRGDAVCAFRNGSCVRTFTPEEFAYLVVLTNCVDDWHTVYIEHFNGEFNINEIMSIVDVMYDFKRTYKQPEHFEPTIDFVKSILKKHGFEYYRPECNINDPIEFDSDLYEAVGTLDNYGFPIGSIVYCTNGGLKNIATNKIIIYPKVYVAK